MATITWDTARANANVIFTNNDLTAARDDANSANYGLFATDGHSTGKRYFEIYVAGASTGGFFGLSSAGFPSNEEIGRDDQVWGLGHNSGQYTYADNNNYLGQKGQSWGAGDTLMCAVDLDSGEAWLGKNGTWWESGDPAAGTNPLYSSVPIGEAIYPSATMGANSGDMSMEARFALSDLVHGPPSGFSAWELPTYKIAGTVLDAAGNPLSLDVRVYPWDGGNLIGETQSAAGDGSYEVTGLTSNDDVLVVAQPSTGDRPLAHGPVTPVVE